MTKPVERFPLLRKEVGRNRLSTREIMFRRGRGKNLLLCARGRRILSMMLRTGEKKLIKKSREFEENVLAQVKDIANLQISPDFPAHQ